MQYLSALATTHEHEPPLAGSLHHTALLLTLTTAIATTVCGYRQASEDSSAAGGSTATTNDGSGSGSGTGRHRAFGIEQQFVKYILRSVTVSVHMCNMYTSYSCRLRSSLDSLDLH
eukprot:3541-Heterococcus_DN1.PRE.1